MSEPSRTSTSLFEQQVRRTPHEVAIVFEQEEVSYAELNRRANQVGHYLRGQGVGAAEVAVGVCVERSVEMVVGLLGVLKAGGVYVPLDATYPQERLAFMMEASGVSVLLAQQHLVDTTAHQAVVVCIDSDWPRISKEPDTNLGEVTSTENLAYIIYTSGSTGKPKGVLVPHRAVANRLLWARAEYPLTEQDSVLQIASFGFDFSVWEIFGPLIAGARVVMARPGGRLGHCLSGRDHRTAEDNDGSLCAVDAASVFGRTRRRNMPTPETRLLRQSATAVSSSGAVFPTFRRGFVQPVWPDRSGHRCHVPQMRTRKSSDDRFPSVVR